MEGRVLLHLLTSVIVRDGYTERTNPAIRRHSDVKDSRSHRHSPWYTFPATSAHHFTVQRVNKDKEKHNCYQATNSGTSTRHSSHCPNKAP